ncbi:MAG: aminoacyl-histidine dipeptidase [Bacteroidetes bacterium]|nr:aminoacyl-histidine dipeptidase [Bacteroidota bacterium]
MSTSAIEGLVPQLVWKRFFEISQIPRPSKSEERIRLYLRNFAGQNNLDMKEDDAGNIVMLVQPSSGFENAPTVVLQGHVDMVCEKNKETDHDFSNDPIKLKRDGEWLTAEGTTLGADNGIGVAAALAVSQDEDFEHGPLELLFTVDEETGLTGANNLQKGFITGKTLLNLDTEEDGAFYVGCSGGMDTVGTYKLETESTVDGYQAYSIFVSGLKGGHSGLNIHEGRANAIKLLGYLLDRLTSLNYQLTDIQGGSKRNAIPREAEAVIMMNPDLDSDAREIINEFSLEAVLGFKGIDENIKITFEKKEIPEVKKLSFRKAFAEKIINAILAMPHGVLAMSKEIPGLVETSTNLATINIEGKEVRIGTSQRSSLENAKKEIARTVRAVFELSGASVKVGDGYPGWQPKMDSKILKLSKKVFQNLFSSEPLVKAVHAGLECGILSDKYPGLEMISFGPTIEGAHSPDERVNIADVEKFYQLLKGILTEMAKKK